MNNFNDTLILYEHLTYAFFVLFALGMVFFVFRKPL